jgi:putative endonuclease
LYTVYILYSTSHDSFYIGFSIDISRRLQQHNDGLTKSTKARRPWVIVYQEKYDSLSEAAKRERFLKNQKNKKFYKKLAGLK